MFTIGNVIISGVKARFLSIANKSAEISEINFPEFVAINDFIDNLTTLSKMTDTRVRRMRIEVMKP